MDLGTILSLIGFGINFKSTVQQVPDSIYILFICLQSMGILVAFFGIVSPSTVRRPDGTALAKYPHTDFWTELKAQGQLFKDWRMLALFIPIFSSEISIIIISTINGKSIKLSLDISLTLVAALYFDIRTRSLNSVLFTIMQLVGASVFIVLLDYEKIGNRRTRGMVSIITMGTIITAGWVGLCIWLYVNPYDALDPPSWDWTNKEFAGFCVLNLIFGSNMVIVS